jgi:hypothetical protein
MTLLASRLNGDQAEARSGQATAIPKSRVVAAGPQYRAGALHRFFFGEGYRSLWGAAISVEVLDLDFAGGLRPTKKGGGKQTLSLTFENREGREWKFRSIDKDPSAVLPEELRDTFVDSLVQDQVSAAHPLGPLVVDPLAEAAGILSAKHRLVLLPDDERLGTFRKEFGGKLGFIEEKFHAEKRLRRASKTFTNCSTPRNCGRGWRNIPRRESMLRPFSGHDSSTCLSTTSIATRTSGSGLAARAAISGSPCPRIGIRLSFATPDWCSH